MKSLWLTVATLLALAAAGCGGDTDSATKTPDRPAPKIEGVTIEGDRLSLADLQGRPVFVNVWSSW
ncbi:MAG: hypothetical protein H0U46_04180 [Actinobacteria bacterium]|nr:hypothetical protein [Actinomycetota bacterium]